MTPQNRISVVIPCYNAAAFLRETLASALGQTYLPHEVIVVDDGSTDDSASIAASFGPLIRIIRQTNQGESVARNRGIAEAQGDWVAFLDADDLWDPKKLERQIEIAAELPPSFVCVYTDYYKFTHATKFASEPLPESHAQPDARVRLLFDYCVHPSSSLVRRETLQTVRFPETVRHGEDILFFASLRDHGRFVRIPDALTGYRMSVSQQTKGRDFLLARTRAAFEWFRENAANYSQAETDYFYGRIRDVITEGHEVAYWKRWHDLVREFRVLFAEVFGEEEAPPLSFQRRLLPTPLYWIKDRFDRIRKTRRSSELVR